jgi:syntaxin-binding protein 1
LTFIIDLIHPPCAFHYKITNVCISLNEFPYIRYYVPSNHLPLGPLKPLPQNRPPTAQETTSRWRTNLARGSEARAYESLESDFVTKLLAFIVQGMLEEHKKLNPEFGVRYFSPFSCKLRD